MLPLVAPTAETERDGRLFAGVAGSVTSAKRFAVEALARAPKPVLDAVEVMVSELASNCDLHAPVMRSAQVSEVGGCG